MKKLLSMFTATSVITSSVTWVTSCNAALNLPYVSNNTISENTKKSINTAVLGDSGSAKISSLFDYNLDNWLEPTKVPSKNILAVAVEDKNITRQESKTMLDSKMIFSSKTESKGTISYLKEQLLTSQQLIKEPWEVVQKYNFYLNAIAKDRTVRDFQTLVNYFDGYNWASSELKDKKRWIYVDQLRSENAMNWFKDAHSWTLDPNNPDFDEKTKFDQGIFFHLLLNNFLQQAQTDYNVLLNSIWNKDGIRNISSDIAVVTFAFTSWSPDKWTKHFVNGHPIVNSNENVYENLPILPIDKPIGIKLVVADVYGRISSYIIGKIVISNLLGI